MPTLVTQSPPPRDEGYPCLVSPQTQFESLQAQPPDSNVLCTKSICVLPPECRPLCLPVGCGGNRTAPWHAGCEVTGLKGAVYTWPSTRLDASSAAGGRSPHPACQGKERAIAAHPALCTVWFQCTLPASRLSCCWSASLLPSTTRAV